MAVPTRDVLLVPYTNNFDARITASPVTFGLTAAQATAYGTLSDAYIAAYNAAAVPGARSRSLVAAKDAAKAALLEIAREYYGFVQSNNAVSDADKELLGVKVRATPSPVPPPADPPGTDIDFVNGRIVKYVIHDSSVSTRRRKAPGAIGAEVYTFVGSTYPSDPTLWQYQGRVTKTELEILYPESLAGGAQVWMCARWYTRRGEVSPISTPISTYIAGGLSMPTSIAA